MKRIVTQPCVVIGSADRASLFRDELQRRGVRFVSAAPSIGSLRRHLVLGEDAAMTLCVLLSVDDLTPTDRKHIVRLLDDRAGFATRLFTIGVVCPSESFTRWAPLGCDAYVNDARAAFEIIHTQAASFDSSETAMTAQQLMRAMPASLMTHASRTSPATSVNAFEPKRTDRVPSTRDVRRGIPPA